MRAKKNESTIVIADLREHLRYHDGALYYCQGRNAGKIAGGKLHKGYRGVRFNGRTLVYSRAVWAVVNGKFPEGIIDHINGVKHDDRIENLRDVSESRNANNHIEHRNGAFPGVVYSKERDYWRAITSREWAGVRFHKRFELGRFDTELEAIAAIKSWRSWIEKSKTIEGTYQGISYKVLKRGINYDRPIRRSRE